MSIVNVVESPRRVVMLTDASLYDASGTIVDFMCKAFPVDSWNGVISFRGNNWGLHTGHAIAEFHASFDEFIEKSAPEIEKSYQAAVENGELSGQVLVEVHAAGWSERDDCAKAFILIGGAPSFCEHPQFVWLPVRHFNSDGIVTADLSPRALWRLHRQGAEPGVDFTPETFEVMRHGLPMIEEQRRGKTDPRMGAMFADKHVIGGDLWFTVVDREGTRQDVIHHWPDEIGQLIKPEPIDEAGLPKIAPSIAEGWSFADWMKALNSGVFDPETFETTKAEPVKMNRDQRRKAKAAARKGKLAHV